MRKRIAIGPPAVSGEWKSNQDTKAIHNFTSEKSLDSFRSCLLSQFEDCLGRYASDGRFRHSTPASPLAQVRAPRLTELFSRIATQAAKKLLKSERPGGPCERRGEGRVGLPALSGRQPWAWLNLFFVVFGLHFDRSALRCSSRRDADRRRLDNAPDPDTQLLTISPRYLTPHARRWQK
jgi:hypothetical protein